MPSSIWSHQAPGLILKTKYPRKIDGTAVCLGAFIPDLDNIPSFIFSMDFRYISHSLLGLIIFIVPLTLISTVIFSRYIGPLCARIAKRDGYFYKPLKYLGIDDWHLLRHKEINKRFWIMASYSALLGGISHLLLDWPSHTEFEIFFPWIVFSNLDFLILSPKDFGFFIPINTPIYRIIWISETIVFFLASFYLLRMMKKKELLKKWYGEQVKRSDGDIFNDDKYNEKNIRE